jgi:hypothetical protein
VPHPEETFAFRELPDDLQEPEIDPKEPKDAVLSAPKSPKEWSKQCKWFGKYGLYKRWKPIVEDFYDTFILKKPLLCYLQVQIITLTRLKNAHQEEHTIREFCNNYLEGFRAHLKSVEQGSDMSRYPTIDDAELYLFIKFGNPNFVGEASYLPDQESFLKYYRSQLIKEYVNKRHDEPELINKTIIELHSDYKPKQINHHLKQISNGLCWYSDDYIKEKYKHLRISSRETV